MTDWYNKLMSEMLDAIANNLGGRAINAANSAWECAERKWITYRQAMEINTLLHNWEVLQDSLNR